MTMDAMIFSDWIDEIIKKKIEAKQLPKDFDVVLDLRKLFVDSLIEHDRKKKMSDGEIENRINDFINSQKRLWNVLDSIAYHQQRDEL